VFISHASEDKPFVLEFATRLRAEEHIDAWVDMWELRAGESLTEGIFERGLKPADAVVVVLSPTSVTKPWVKRELGTAVNRGIDDEDFRVIPILIESLPSADVPTSLRDILHIRHSDMDATIADVVKALGGRTGKPPVGTRNHGTVPLSQWGDAIRQAYTAESIGDRVVELSGLRWLVGGIEDQVDPPQALLLSEDCVARLPYHHKLERATWAECTLRTWLNTADDWVRPLEQDDFDLEKTVHGDPLVWPRRGFLSRLDSAFVDRIGATRVLTPIESPFLRHTRFDPHAIEWDVARVFLLGTGDLHFFCSAGRSEMQARYQGEPYAWWLRSSGLLPSYPPFITEEGYLNDICGTVGEDPIGVRPALYLGLEP
jgi:hypothetical protein